MKLYFEELQKKIKTNLATEHTYRSDLQGLIERITNITVLNEPKRLQCGAPDLILVRDGIPIGYVETKDIGSNLDRERESIQLMRYRKSLSCLILTDYLTFYFYRDGSEIERISIAHLDREILFTHNDNLKKFSKIVFEFFLSKCKVIESASQLAKSMASKSNLLSEILIKAVLNPVEDQSLKHQLKAFKDILISDLDEKTFSDLYAQTIAYGLFAASLYHSRVEPFSRPKALFLIPKSNPFLRQLFSYIAGPNLDDRVVWIVDDLADLFNYVNFDLVFNNLQPINNADPFIHFYETFLKEYDPELRKLRGVFYTPEPIVNFIVRGVDYSLKNYFGFSLGLADTNKIDSLHRVQILDPALGTGTFLCEIIKVIFDKFKTQLGVWSSYVENELIPRLNGFEILMAPYTIAHIKLSHLLNQTGFKPTKDFRLKMFLTNSLEEVSSRIDTTFTSWLLSESQEANSLKKESPIMVVVGNPPYSNFGSANQGSFIKDLLAVYREGVIEKKTNLHDDYIKFLRYAEHFIERTGNGIVAMITNYSYLKGISQKQMRKHLSTTFDKIFICNLHGDVRKKERYASRTRDENVFDIPQGVAIGIFIKNDLNTESESCNIYYYDLFGSRASKYEFLLNESLDSIKWIEFQPFEPLWQFIPPIETSEDYFNFTSISDIFTKHSSGVQTKCDELSVHFKKHTLLEVIQDFLSFPVEKLKIKYRKEETSGWNYSQAKDDLLTNNRIIYKLLYRPFDMRVSVYTGKTSGFIGRPRRNIMQHMIDHDNIGLIFNRRVGNIEFTHIGVSNTPICHGTFYLGNVGQDYFAPLYLYDSDNTRKPNINKTFILSIVKRTGLAYLKEKRKQRCFFSPIDILDYLIAILSCPTYRQKYNEYLKDDFPRVQLPNSKISFVKMIEKGTRLRKLLLLEAEDIDPFTVGFSVQGTNRIDRVKYDTKKVWINDSQFFGDVSNRVWEFEIGGYRPAELWLKVRKSQVLDFTEIIHYQKIVASIELILETKIEIDEIYNQLF